MTKGNRRFNASNLSARRGRFKTPSVPDSAVEPAAAKAL